MNTGGYSTVPGLTSCRLSRKGLSVRLKLTYTQEERSVFPSLLSWKSKIHSCSNIYKTDLLVGVEWEWGGGGRGGRGDRWGDRSEAKGGRQSLGKLILRSKGIQNTAILAGMKTF